MIQGALQTSVSKSEPDRLSRALDVAEVHKRSTSWATSSRGTTWETERDKSRRPEVCVVCQTVCNPTTSLPGWKGDLLIAGLFAQGVVRLTLDGEKVTGEERIGLGHCIRNAVQGPNGAVYALTDKSGGEILRVSADGPPS